MVKMKNLMFWVVTPCSPVPTFRGNVLAHRHDKRRYWCNAQGASWGGYFLFDLNLFGISSTQKMEAIGLRSSKSSVIYQTTRRHIPGDNILLIWLVNYKSQTADVNIVISRNAVTFNWLVLLLNFVEVGRTNNIPRHINIFSSRNKSKFYRTS
jgi:hypothetical protein